MKPHINVMIDIYCTGGAYFGVLLDFDVMLEIMRDDIIKPDDFIEFRFEDGGRGAVQKKHINGFTEIREEV